MIPLRWRLLLPLTRFNRQSPVTSAGGATRFVLLAKQRSGSTWVADLLNSHPSVLTFAELFQHDSWGSPQIGGETSVPFWNSWRALHGRPSGRRELFLRYQQYLNEVVFAPRENVQAIGFKLMYNQLSSAFALPAYLRENDVRVVHLVRRNLLDCILSVEAVARRSVSLAAEGASVPTVTFDLETHSLIERLEDRESEVEAAQRFVEQFGVPSCEIEYESLQNDVQALSGVTRFLGLAYRDHHFSSGMKKLNPRSQRQILSNFDEVQSVLAGTRFESMLRG